MEEKRTRQNAIIKLLEERAFDSQEAVTDALQGQGFKTTQSGISRDFAELGIVKVSGRYCRAVPADSSGNSAFSGISGLVLGGEPAGKHLLVIRTAVGAANVVAHAIDSTSLEGVSGTVAGDDTIFIATRGRAAQRRLLEFLSL